MQPRSLIPAQRSRPLIPTQRKSVEGDGTGTSWT
jgi:hypothetical protein